MQAIFRTDRRRLLPCHPPQDGKTPETITAKAETRKPQGKRQRAPPKPAPRVTEAYKLINLNVQITPSDPEFPAQGQAGSLSPGCSGMLQDACFFTSIQNSAVCD